jgi:membrane peptidoglycan carboxypeptidase
MKRVPIISQKNNLEMTPPSTKSTALVPVKSLPNLLNQSLNTKKRKSKLNSITRKIRGCILALFIFLFITIIIGGGIFLSQVGEWSKNLPNIRDVILTDLSQSSIVYDVKGNQIQRVVGTDATKSLDRDLIEDMETEVPMDVRFAFLLAEDKNFYEHSGVDWLATARCVYISLTTGSQCGASGITQQVIKNTVLEGGITSCDGMTQNDCRMAKLEEKLKQIVSSLRLEDQELANYEGDKTKLKNDILKYYLNRQDFGGLVGNIAGLKRASKYFFNKDIKDLTLAEAALFGGIPQNPGIYNPYNGWGKTEVYCRYKTGDQMPEDALTIQRDTETDAIISITTDDPNDIIKIVPRYKCRQLYVLGQFEKNLDLLAKYDVHLTEEDINAAREQELVFEQAKTELKYAYFMQMAMEQLRDEDSKYIDGKPFTQKDLETKGYKIYLTLDPEIQGIVETEIKNWVDGTPECRDQNQCPDNLSKGVAKRFGMNNAAFGVMDTKTGALIALTGGKDYNAEEIPSEKGAGLSKFAPQVNVFTSAQQPGSTFKPIGLLAGLKTGAVYPSAFIPNIATNALGYSPGNAGVPPIFHGFNQKSYLRYGVQQSYNQTMIQAQDIIGTTDIINMVENLGYTYFGQEDYSKDPSLYGLSTILGTKEVRPIEHLTAYAAVANMGKYHPYQLIQRIEDRDGKVLWEYKPEQVEKQVLDSATAYLAIDMMRNYIDYNDYSHYPINQVIKAWDYAGKTGTTNDNADNLYVHLTPTVTSLVWVGNDDNSYPANNGEGLPWGYNTSIPITSKIMSRILPILDPTKSKFATPDTITTVKICAQTGKPYNPASGCAPTMNEIFAKDRVPSIDNSFVVGKVCTDKLATNPEAKSKYQVARDIDTLYGFSMDGAIRYVRAMKASQQKMFDAGTRQESSSGNVCDTDYTKIVGDPIVTISQPIASQSYTSNNNNNNVQVAATATPILGKIVSMHVYIDGVLISSSTEGSISTTYNLPNNFTAGTHTLSVTATDAGGRSATNQVSFTYTVVNGNGNGNNNAGSVQWNSLPASHTVNTPLIVSGSYTGVDNYSSILLKITGTENQELTMTGPMSNFTTTWTPTLAGIYNLKIFYTTTSGTQVLSSIKTIIIN